MTQHTDTLPLRADVFLAGRKMSQPTIDFSGFTSDISDLKHLPNTDGDFYDAANRFVGYHIVLKPMILMICINK